ncbi:hypothetical protein ACFZCY_18590 [Streptomyces sp. NPDC007983]|uniref:hypothetical protein n=1 Tax=Streptomyces sp. NPDC007983 TaxID=3364800 RepID=UPI0036E16E06
MSDEYSYQIRRLTNQTSSVESELLSLRSELGEVDDLGYEQSPPTGRCRADRPRQRLVLSGAAGGTGS